MSKNLNENLYSRFGLTLELEKVQDGFKKYIKNLLLESLDPIIFPVTYEDENKLFKIQREILRELCKQMFLDYNDYSNFNYGFKWFIEKEFYEEFDGSFLEYIIRLQILLNVVYKYKFIKHEFDHLTSQISSYLDAFPILELKLKKYKTKAPQILPSVSRFFDKDIENTLGLLENKPYQSVLEHFEEGLKEFLAAKTKNQLKDVVEDMHSACDEAVKIILNDSNKSFKHVYDKKEYKRLGLNGHQKEIFKNLKNWIDGIKHGSIKDFSREDVEMIISLVAVFLRFVINKHISKQ